jgi:hypothetical protein
VWHPRPDQLALAALPAEAPQPQIETHLAGCGPCREELAQLRRLVALAQAGDTDPDESAPPERIWRSIVDELGTGFEPAPRPPLMANRRGSRLGSGTGRWQRWVLPAATAAAGIAAGIAIGFAVAVPPPAAPLTQVALAPVAATDPTASGRAQLVDAGDAREVVVEVVDPVGTSGGYLEAWLMDEAGTRLYSLGTLTPEADATRFRGTFELPADLPLDRYGTVDVSAEPLDGDPSHSGASRLRGQFT